MKCLWLTLHWIQATLLSIDWYCRLQPCGVHSGSVLSLMAATECTCSLVALFGATYVLKQKKKKKTGYFAIIISFKTPLTYVKTPSPDLNIIHAQAQFSVQPKRKTVYKCNNPLRFGWLGTCQSLRRLYENDFCPPLYL